MSDDHEQRLATLLAEMLDQNQRGLQVDLETICREHPDLSEDLRELWGAMALADMAGETSMSGQSPPSESVAPLLELPCVMGDYEFLEELGRGGMGVVYRARQLSLDREVAVKMLLGGSMSSETERRRFQAEAEAAAKLDHPHIVPVYEVGELDGRPYFSMKYIAGRTLAQKLSANPLDPRRAAKIIAIVSEAIDYAHSQGVLHRDLKPSNILIDSQGQPHVSDFGLAKRITDAASLTKTGTALGTPGYMAPEQAAGARGQVSPASDVYSLGGILYHTLTGRPPFQAATPVDTVLLVLEQDPAPPRLLNPKADRDLEMIAMRCLQKPPDLRYDRAQYLADDLRAYLSDEPIAARSGRFLQVVSRMFRETHHAALLENWGVLWMWHSLVILVACGLTKGLQLLQVENRWYYIALWTAGLGAWAAVFWALRRRLGPVTFVERQIAHVWGSAMLAIGMLFFVEWVLGMPVLSLAPVLGLINGMMFFVKAGILSGSFYLQAFLLFAASMFMAWFPEWSHVIFGVVAAGCFFFPGLKYYRQRKRAERADDSIPHDPFLIASTVD